MQTRLVVDGLTDGLTEALATSDTARINGLRSEIAAHPEPWRIHLALFPEVERVLNPPFINPHLPKMYSICRDFVPYLSKRGMASLVYLELVEYARRTKLEKLAPHSTPDYPVTFEEVEKSIAQGDRDETARRMNAFVGRHGLRDLIRHLLLLGSGYLETSIGHSVSCTAFILLELLHRDATEAWPSLVLLADYFCKGHFHATPRLIGHSAEPPSRDDLYRSVTGSGFVDIHHTITLYAIERARPFLNHQEQGHMIASWVAWLGTKESRPRLFPGPGTAARAIDDYDDFKRAFVQFDADRVLGLAGGMLEGLDHRSRLCSFLVESVCDLYQGNYNPHYLTGLGALLWVLDTYHREAGLVQNALYQYLDFFFSAMKPKE